MTTLPAWHYEAVVEVYKEAAAEGLRPAQAVAETWGAPVNTAYRWIKEARRQGLLAARGKGKSETICKGRCGVCCGKTTWPDPVFNHGELVRTETHGDEIIHFYNRVESS